MFHSSLLGNKCVSRGFQNSMRALTTASKSKAVLGSLSGKNVVLGPSRKLPAQYHNKFCRQQNMLRFFSSDTSSKKDGSSDKKTQEDGSDETQIVLTPGQKVVAYSRLGMWAGIFAFACACAYYIGRELFPTKMSPNSVFDGALAVVRDHPAVIQRYGAPIKGYGRDHGGHREGRRNFIEHTQYVDKEDGSNRTRVRFNIEGPYGNAFVFAEVSSSMPSGEYVYVLVQDKANGRVQTVVDNRSALTAARLAGDSKETMAAMSQLLGGGKRT